MVVLMNSNGVLELGGFHGGIGRTNMIMKPDTRSSRTAEVQERRFMRGR